MSTGTASYRATGGRCRIARALLLLLGALLAGACGATGNVPITTGASATPTDTTSSTREPDHRIVLAREGGRCLAEDGGGTVCRTRVTIEESAWRATGSALPTPETGTVEPDTFEALVTLLDEGFDGLTAEPFDGSCPTAHDGQELTIELWELPNDPLADADVRTTSSCIHDWRVPDARRVTDALHDLLDRADIPFAAAR